MTALKVKDADCIRTPRNARFRPRLAASPSGFVHARDLPRVAAARDGPGP